MTAGERVFSPSGRIAHLSRVNGLLTLCRLETAGWLGTGSDEERKHAAGLPLCGKCERSSGRRT